MWKLSKSTSQIFYFVLLCFQIYLPKTKIKTLSFGFEAIVTLNFLFQIWMNCFFAQSNSNFRYFQNISSLLWKIYSLVIPLVQVPDFKELLFQWIFVLNFHLHLYFHLNLYFHFKERFHWYFRFLFNSNFILIFHWRSVLHFLDFN